MNPQALEELKQEFETWRANRQSRFDRVPPVLKARARAMVAEFSEKQIRRATGLTRNNLFPRPSKKQNSAGQFVELGQMPLPTPSIEIEIRSEAHVILLRVAGTTPLSQLISLLKS